MKIIHKPWGREEWIELNDRYCYKRIYINKGHKTSFQYHKLKTETNYIISGSAEIWLENNEGVVEKKVMDEGDYFNVLPLRKHRVIAITDLILQEVSTPEVDDVVRIEDENQRKDGKIEGEHLNPAVLILAAGTGSRLGYITEATNKVLLPINNRAIISHIIEKFPPTYDFIITIGYKGDIVEEYCRIAFPNHNFTFVLIDKFEGEGTGPGYSTLKCKEYLQRPFYFIMGDCIIDSPMPPIDYNWIGVTPTSSPEIYSTLKIDGFGNVNEFMNKSKDGFDLAFIGLGAIWNYEIFWDELKRRMVGGEIVSAFENPSSYPTLKSRYFKWFDTGNLSELSKTKEYFKDNPLSLSKLNDEITYKENNKLIKFTPNETTLLNREKRAEHLRGIIPENLRFTKYFMVYDWVEGKTLYEADSIEVYKKFLSFLNTRFMSVCKSNEESIYEFYVNKTHTRRDLFLRRFGSIFNIAKFNINGVDYDSMENLFKKINFDLIKNALFYTQFHGDLQFDNIVFSEEKNDFVYIDWRENFGNSTESGDLYYDLAKLYGGLIIPYNLMKEERNIMLIRDIDKIVYDYPVPENLTKFKVIFETWVSEQGFSLKHIKLTTALIYLNMAPLHDEKFSKVLWFKSIQMISENL